MIQETRLCERIISRSRIGVVIPVLLFSSGLSWAGDGFNIGDTNFRIGGFVDFDATYIDLDGGSFANSSTSAVRDFYIPGAIPVGGQSSSFLDFTAESSRVSIAARRKVADEVILGHVEVDFLLSGQGNERVSNSYAVRLRRAFVDYRGFRVGQEWTTFLNLSSLPESVSFLTASNSMIFTRQAMIRYTQGPFQIALENPASTIYLAPGVSTSRSTIDESVLPDLIGRYNLRGDFGNVSIAGIVRQLRDQTDTATSSSIRDVIGWGVSASGRIKAGSAADFRFGAAYGAGLGRYIGLNTLPGALVKPSDASLEALVSYGAHGAINYKMGKATRLSAGGSYFAADLPDYTVVTTTKSTWSVFGAVLTDIAPKLTIGGQIEYGSRTLKDDTSGRIIRLTASVRYGF